MSSLLVIIYNIIFGLGWIEFDSMRVGLTQS